MSTSKLQEYTTVELYRHFPHLTIKENHRPDWLSTGNGNSLELDLYIVELKIAIEIQGHQHYIFVPFFHGNYDGFLEQQERDNVKRHICALENVTLYEVSNKREARDTILDISGEANRKEALYKLRRVYIKRRLSRIEYWSYNRLRWLRRFILNKNRLQRKVAETRSRRKEAIKKIPGKWKRFSEGQRKPLVNSEIALQKLDLNKFTIKLIDELNENDPKAILAIYFAVNILGQEKCKLLLAKAKKMYSFKPLISDGSRMKELGGCFFDCMEKQDRHMTRMKMIEFRRAIFAKEHSHELYDIWMSDYKKRKIQKKEIIAL